jgi:benzoyl-CoA reductase/2-hydroxyglutaryl-CoA dehydratase subunit BcrC/BadD/HgdB
VKEKKMAKKTLLKEVAYSCSYVPIEILDSFGLKPVYNLGDNRNVDISQQYLHQNMCGFVRDIVNRNPDNAYDAILTNCCDSFIHLNTVYNLHPDYQNTFNYMISLPRSFEDIDIEFWPNVLKHFIGKLEDATGKKFNEANLVKSIEKCNRWREGLRRAENLLLENKIWGSEYVRLITDTYNLGVDESLDLVTSFLEEHQNGEEKDAEWGILLTGANFPAALSFAEHSELYDANVRYFDTCNLARYYNVSISETLSPLEALSKGYLSKSPCSRLKASKFRYMELLGKIDEYGLDAVVYHTLKFCDQNIMDAVMFKEMCEGKDIPFIRIETDHESEVSGQIKTRVEALLEML